MTEEVRYKARYAAKSEIDSARGPVILLSSGRDNVKYSLKPDEFELFQLFDGKRSLEEIMDAVYKQKGVRIARPDLEAFVEKLADSGLLERVRIARRTPAEQARPLMGAWRAIQGGRPQPADWNPDEGAPPPPPRDPADPLMERGQHWLASELGLPPEEDWTWDDFKARPRERRSGDEEPGVQEQWKQLLADRYLNFKKKGITELFDVPIRGLLPVGALLLAPLRNRWTVGVLVALVLATVYGIYANRVEFYRDVVRLFEPLNLVQILLISMFSVNLFGQLARAAAFRRALDKPPPFKLVLILNLIPRFLADVGEFILVRDRHQQRVIIGAAMATSAQLFVLSTALWIMAKGSGTFLPLLALGVSVTSGIALLIALNPLAKLDGYYLLASLTRVPDLRERAFLSLFTSRDVRVDRLFRSRPVPKWVLRVYGLAVIAFLVTVCVLIGMNVGTWLEINWGGLGVIVFLIGTAVVLYEPLREAKHTAARLAEVRRVPNAPRTERERRKRRKKRYKMLAGFGVFAVIAMLPYPYEPGGEFVLLPAERVDVRALVSGDIRQIFVKEGEFVEKGQLLAKLAADEEEKNLAIAKARIIELQAKLKIAEQGATAEAIAAAQQRVNTARSRYNFSSKEARRLKELYDQHVIPAQQYESAVQRAAIDRELLEQAKLDLEVVKQKARPEEIEAIKAEIHSQETLRDYYEQQLRYSELRAPISGHIVSGSLQYAVGNFLSQGELFATIEDNKHLVAAIRVPEEDIGEVRIGARVGVKPWAYPDREFTGTVTSIAPTAEPTPYGKVVRVLSEMDNTSGLLKSEMTGYAKIEGEDKPVIVAFTRMLVRFFLVEIWSWLP